ncbi:ATP-binding protein [Acidianus manzaensis]|uniref:ATPase n=1 Tax=Acidianus manzaensis TaxID=282676 RepID=A0A1W6K0N3_9CREN|nr:ATP-binding protein [Acidianus manzaensis]ARM76086.1 ATPase [Acidianus manzaensis]
MEEGLFEQTIGKLRELKVYSRQTADGRGSVSFRSFIIEFPVNSNLSAGKLLAVKAINNDYLILEVTDILPVHYGMINLDNSIPREIRDEVMKKVEESWGKSDDESWLDVYAYPIGYLLKFNNNIEFYKGYSPPIPGSTVYIFSKSLYENFVCEKNGEKIGTIIGENADLRINLDKAINYHIGVFAFTGSGKSNLTSTLIRRILKKNVKVVVFDISLEYGILLLDLLLNENSRLITTERLPINSIDAGRRFIRTHVIPEELLDLKDEIMKISSEIYNQGKMKQLYVPPEGSTYLTYGEIIDMVRAQINDKYTAFAQKPLFGLLLKKIDEIMRENKLSKEDIADNTLNPALEEIEELGKSSGLKENASIFAFLNSLKVYLSSEVKEGEEYDIEKLAIEIMDNDQNSPKLFILELSNMEEARSIVAQLINTIMARRKRSYSTTPILFVLDEAQEFIPFDTRQKDYSELSSNAVEKLLRHGRKYHLHGLISTQRLAYLNTNVLQQLHTYFISTLPRPYDRQLISETFGISDALMDRTLDLEVGQWLLISFKAALSHDVPVFFTAPNNFNELKESFQNSRSSSSIG